MRVDAQYQNTLESTFAALACAVVGLGYVAFFDVEPVGIRAADFAWTAALGALVGLIVPRVPAWLMTAASFGALAFVESTLGATIAIVAMVMALLLVRRGGWSTSITETASGAVRRLLLLITPSALFAATLMFHDHGRPFASAVFAGTIWTTVAGAAWLGLPKRPRRTIAYLTGLTLLAVAAVGAGAALQLREAYDDALAMERQLRAGADAAYAADFDSTSHSIALASSHAQRAQSSFSSPLISALRHTPIAGPNLQTAHAGLHSAGALVASAKDAATIASELDELVGEDGIALGEVERLTLAADAVLRDARGLSETLEHDHGVWVVSPLADRLHAAAERTTAIEELDGLSVNDAARRLLGGDEQRSYLVLLGNTAEARELGGFAGGTALLTFDDGAISLARADRPEALNERPADIGVFDSIPPQRFLDHRPWLYSQNFTAMSDFPTLAASLADLYPNMGGEPIDGVAYLDPLALSAILDLVGEIHLDKANMTVEADSIAHLVNIGQYEQFETNDEREDFLGELIATTFEEALSSGAELDVAKFPELVRVIQQDRLLFVPFDDDEFTMMEAAGVIGELSPPDGHDYLAVSHLNGGPNKLDAYLHRSVSYRAEVDPRTGQLDATLEITLRNDAPTKLSNYASSNQQGYPRGTNRAIIVVHTPHDAVEWSGGHEHELTRSWHEFGLQRHEQVVAIPRGHSRTVTLRLRGEVVPGDYRLDVGHQPLVHNDKMLINVEPTTGTFDGLTNREFRLQRDSEFEAAWTPTAAPLARVVGGE